MAKKRYKVGDVIHVAWMDSATYARWHPIDSEPLTPVMCASVGWLIWDHKDYITVAGSIGTEDHPEAADFMTIPKGVIQKVTRLDAP